MSQVIAVREPVIRTPDQRLRVFVSSTLAELAPERAAVRSAVERLHLIPVLFELGARPHPPRALYRSYLAQSHVFIGIYWQRYGWVAPGEDVSGLEDEYRLASGMPQLLYVKRPAPEREPRLTELLERVQTDDRASYRAFSTPEELGQLVEDDLAVLLTERFEVASSRAPIEGPSTVSVVSPAPVPLTPTVGREADIAAVADLLTGAGTRLVTVTGPGGVGKSRLALEIARRLEGRFADGVHFVPLEPLTDPRGLLRAIADHLGIIGEGLQHVDDLVAERLGERELLLIVDNFEHVIDAGPDLAALLDRCPGVRAFVTSRRPLRLRGEQEYPLAPLAVPEDPGNRETHDTDAVELFVQRARGVRPDFQVTADNAVAIAELVRRLDGLPLAIELAAARVRLLPPEVLLDRLEERLDVLSSGAHDLPGRQRTLRETIAWSYRLLGPDEQRLLDRLSVFAGGASIEAAEAVCVDPGGGDVLEALSSLLESSLVISTISSGEPRVQLYNTVRTYARERLEERGEVALIADRHADWFLGRAVLVDPLTNPAAHHRFETMLGEADDIRAAMDWSLARGDIRRTAAFAGSTLIWFWLTGRIEGMRGWYEDAAELAARPEARPKDRTWLLYVLGQVREMVGDAVGAVEASEEALELAEEVGDDLAAGAALLTMASALPHLGRRSEAIERAREGLVIGERLGVPDLIGYASAIIATALTVEGDYDGARRGHELALSTSRGVGIPILEAQGITQLALIDALEHRFDDAWRRLREAAEILPATRNREVLSYWLESAGVAFLLSDEPQLALRTLVAAAQVREDVGLVIWPLLAPAHDAWVQEATGLCGDAAQRIEAAARGVDGWREMQAIQSLAPQEGGG